MQRACARAPVRVDPAGGGTDAPPFSVEQGGAVLNIAVARYAYASVDRLPAGSGVTIFAEDLGTGVTANSSAELTGGALEFLQAFVRRLVPPSDSVLLVTESDVPAGAGLGGSGALGVAVVAAIDRAYGRSRSADEIARLANEIERLDLGYPGGDQDSFGAALGGVNLLEYPVGGRTTHRKVAVPSATLREIERRSLLIYTSEAHVSGNIHADIKNAYADVHSPTRRALVRLREEALKMAPALEAGDLDGYADALNASSRNLYRLHPSCDSEAHRRCFEELGELIAAGKTCGAGGGGFLVAFTAPGARRTAWRAAEALDARVWPLTIDTEGVSAWDEKPLAPDVAEAIRTRAASVDD